MLLEGNNVKSVFDIIIQSHYSPYMLDLFYQKKYLKYKVKYLQLKSKYNI